jgi:hypothetical protein
LFSRPFNSAKSTHGNALTNADSVLYAKLDAKGQFLKWGITKEIADPSKRYPLRSYTDAKGRLIEGLDGGRLKIVNRAGRIENAALERFLTERIPGPRNFEPWKGTMPPRSN